MKKILTILLLTQLNYVTGMQQEWAQSCCSELCCASSLALSVDGLIHLCDYDDRQGPERDRFDMRTPLRAAELGCAALCLYMGVKKQMHPDHLVVDPHWAQKGWQDSYEQCCCARTCRATGEDLSALMLYCCCTHEYSSSNGFSVDPSPMIEAAGICGGALCLYIGAREHSANPDHWCIANKYRSLVSRIKHKDAQAPHAQHME